MLPPEFAGNVWAEREYDSKQIIFDGEGPNKDELPIRGASLNQLIMRLTCVRTVDQNFMKTFLMTYSSFTTAEDVMLKLEERFGKNTRFELFEITQPSFVGTLSLMVFQWLRTKSAHYN